MRGVRSGFLLRALIGVTTTALGIGGLQGLAEAAPSSTERVAAAVPSGSPMALTPPRAAIADISPASVLRKPGRPERVTELPGRRTATSKSFVMSNGSTQVELSTAPVHYKDSKGAWREIDTRVVAGEGEDAFANAKNSFGVRFGKDTGRLVRFESNGASIALGVAGERSKVSPVAQGSTVRFPDVFGGADVRYVVSPEGLKEDIVLDKVSEAAVAFQFQLTTGGLTARELGDGSIGFFKKASDERPRFVMPAPFMYDATYTGPAGPGWSSKVTQSLETTGGKTTLTLTPDQGWLRDAARRFPVVVDPTVVVVPAPTEAQDTAIDSATPGANWGSSPNLLVGRASSTSTWRSLVKFAWDPAVIPAGAQISSANLDLHFAAPFAAESPAVPLEAREVTQPWTEATTTWATSNTAYVAGAAGVPFTSTTVDDSDLDHVDYAGNWDPATDVRNIGGSASLTPASTLAESFTWNGRVPSPGSYKVEAFYVPAANRGTPSYAVVGPSGDSTSTASATVNQAAGAVTGQWTTLVASKFFTPGRPAKVTLNRITPTSTASAPMADAVRWTESATQVKEANQRDAWHSYAVTSLMQRWVNGTTANNGFMLKAADEATGPLGGPNYNASEDVFGGETSLRPKLVVTFDEAGVALNPPATVHASGPELTWAEYADPSPAEGDDIVGYEIHRGCRVLPASAGGCPVPVGDHFRTGTGTGIERIASLETDARSWTDTTAVASTATEAAVYNYWVVVRTKADEVPSGTARAASNVATVTIPRQGRIVRSLDASQDTTLSAAQPGTVLASPDGRSWLQVGNAHATYGDERAILRFDTTKITKGVKVTAARLELFASSNQTCAGCGAATFDLHPIKTPFLEGEATWAKANATTTWPNSAGDPDTTVLLGTLSAAPASARRLSFAEDALLARVQEWVNVPPPGSPLENDGLLLKTRTETVAQQWINLVNSESADTTVRPRLVIEHLVKNDAQTIEATQIPERWVPGTEVTTPVLVTNTTDQNMEAGLQLSYRWTDVNTGTDITVEGDRRYVPLGRVLAPGESVELALPIRTPINADTGTGRRLSYDLYLDLWRTNETWLYGTPGEVGDLTQNQGCVMGVAGLLCVDRYVEDPTSTHIGLEKFGTYTGEETGAGSQFLTNLYSGNAIWSYDAISNPSTGPSAFVRVTYNSMDVPDRGAGSGFSVQAGTLIRLGDKLSVPSGGSSADRMTFIDGDGTTQTYKKDLKVGDVTTYTRPAGVALELRRDEAADDAHEWVFTRPDGTRFYFAQSTGRATSVVDYVGRALTYKYEDATSTDRITEVTDSSDTGVLKLKWDTAGLVSITDVSNRALKFSYTPSHQLDKLEDGRVDAAGDFSGTEGVKKFDFDYTEASVNSNAKLKQVIDPRDHETDIRYFASTVSSFNKNWVESYDDRRENTTTFTYAVPVGAQAKELEAVVTDANGSTPSVTTYSMDGFGRTTAIKDANAHASGSADKTLLGWDRDHNVTRLQEPDGAVSTWKFDPATGYPTTVRDAEAVAKATAGTELTYAAQSITQTLPDGFVSTFDRAVLATKVSPEGRKSVFGYNGLGHLTSVTQNLSKDQPVSDPAARTTTFTYNGAGNLIESKDPKDQVTKYGNYHVTGYPRTITDAATKVTTFGYDVRGNVTQVIDALNQVTTAEYDDFGRPDLISTPHDGVSSRNVSTSYDLNDNLLSETAPNGASTTHTYGEADQILDSTLPSNGGTGTRKVSYSYDALGQLVEQTAPLGNLTASNPDDYVTRYTYDRVGQTVKVNSPFVDTDGTARNPAVSFAYDKVGNRSQVTDPEGNVSKTAFDLNHRPVSTTDAAGFTTKVVYDRDGLVTGEIDALGNTKSTGYDASGRPISVAVPHTPINEPKVVKTTRIEYDAAGNQVVVQRPSGVRDRTNYDALNRPVETIAAENHAADQVRTSVVYDELGRVKQQSDPWRGTQTKTWTNFTYWPSGDIKTSTDAWNISTAFTYDKLGQQLSRTLSNNLDDATRAMSWTYHPDGTLKSRSDQAAKAPTETIDNVVPGAAELTGTWASVTTGTNMVGSNYRTHAAAAAGTAEASAYFRWTHSPQATGAYEVWVSCPVRADASTAASYTVTHNGGTHLYTVNQKSCTSATPWMKVGPDLNFSAGSTHTVTLKPSTTGVVSADALKVVPKSGAAAAKTFTYFYDANGQQSEITDSTPGTVTARFAIDYDGLGRTAKVEEFAQLASLPSRVTDYSYDLNSNVTSVHARRTSGTSVSRYTEFDYDVRNQIKTTKFGATPTSTLSTVSYTYDPRGMRQTMTKPGPTAATTGNVTTYGYHEDGLLKTTAEKLSPANGSAVVTSHSLWYNLDGDRRREVSKVDDAGAAGYLDQTADYTYSPTRQLRSVLKSGPDAGVKEAFTYDVAGNMLTQQFDAGAVTTNIYDRNRLTTSTQGTTVRRDRYDSLGRQTAVTTGNIVRERLAYDGWDRVVSDRRYDPTGAALSTKTFAYDALDRTTTETEKIQTAATTTNRYTYLGISDQVAAEEKTNTAGAFEVSKAYTYGPGGEKIALVDSPVNATTVKTTHYSLNPHGDVEALTDATTGQTTATYGYRAYGDAEPKSTTGLDKIENDPVKDADIVNPYRYSGKRVEPASGKYDMGFRDYDPKLNRFLTRDMYNGALSDMALGSDPWNTNRYAFAGGNPISRVELDGHFTVNEDGSKASNVSSLHPHDGAVLATKAAALAWMEETGFEGRVTVDVGKGGKIDNRIPGGAKDGLGGVGYADLIIWGMGKNEKQIFIYEIKPGNAYGRASGPAQLERYIEKLADANPGKVVLPGPVLKRRSYLAAGGKYSVWSEGASPGMRFYGKDKARRTPRPPSDFRFRTPRAQDEKRRPSDHPQAPPDPFGAIDAEDFVVSEESADSALLGVAAGVVLFGLGWAACAATGGAGC